MPWFRYVQAKQFPSFSFGWHRVRLGHQRFHSPKTKTMCVRAGIYDQTNNSAVIKALPCIFFKGKEGKSLIFCPLLIRSNSNHTFYFQAYSLTLLHRKEINKNKNRKKKNVAKNFKIIVKVIKKA